MGFIIATSKLRSLAWPAPFWAMWGYSKQAWKIRSKACYQKMGINIMLWLVPTARLGCQRQLIILLLGAQNTQFAVCGSCLCQCDSAVCCWVGSFRQAQQGRGWWDRNSIYSMHAAGYKSKPRTATMYACVYRVVPIYVSVSSAYQPSSPSLPQTLPQIQDVADF